MRADGVASIGVGLFGVLITLIPYRRRERWAWFALWFYPAFWVVHLVGRLPPSKDHVHQVVFCPMHNQQWTLHLSAQRFQCEPVRYLTHVALLGNTECLSYRGAGDG